MAIQGTNGTLTNSVRTAYGNKYIEAASMERVYDQFARAVGQDGVEQAAKLNNSVQVPFLSDMQVTETVISEVADINPQTLRDSTATITPTSRADALQWSEALDLKVYTNYGESRFQKLGKNMMETVDLLAQAACLKGGNVMRAAARASLDAGTTSHNLSDLSFAQAESRLITAKAVPFINRAGERQWIALGHPDVFYDLRASGNVLSVAQYQDKEIILNGELGMFGKFKIVSPAWAKVFGGAGADAVSVAVTTLTTAANALALTIAIASSTNIEVGKWLTLGTEETGNTHYPMNERVKVSADYTTGLTLNIIGEGANGGLRFPHAAGTSLFNSDSVYPVVFGGPSSIAKLWAMDLGADDPEAQGMGEFGVIVGPKRDGLVNQFASIGWKWYGGYGRWNEAWVLRGEFTTRLDA